MSDNDIDQRILDVSQRSNVDQCTFYQRQELGRRLRDLNPDRVPILLYWHRDMDDAGSLHGMPNGVPDALPPKTFARNARDAIIGQRRLADGLPAIMKVLVRLDQNVGYLQKNLCTKMACAAKRFVKQQFQSDFDHVWQQRQLLVAKHLPQWSNDDKEIVPVFYAARMKKASELPADTSIATIDQWMRGDDHLNRLFVSFEFRRLHQNAVGRDNDDDDDNNNSDDSDSDDSDEHVSLPTESATHTALRKTTENVAFISGALVGTGAQAVNGVFSNSTSALKYAGSIVGSSLSKTADTVAQAREKMLARVKRK